MLIRQNTSRNEPTIHPQWGSFLEKTERRGSPLSTSSQKRVDALIRTQLREGRPFFWFCMTAYQNGFLFTNSQKEMFKDHFPMTYKWIQFQQEHVHNDEQRAHVMNLYQTYENGVIDLIGLLTDIYALLTPAQQTQFRLPKWYQNIHRWHEFATAAGITHNQRAYVADRHAETLICESATAELYRRALGKIYHSRNNVLSNEQKVQMRLSYPEMDFIVDIISTNNQTTLGKRRRQAVARWTPADNNQDARMPLSAIAPDDNDCDTNSQSMTHSPSNSQSSSSSDSSSLPVNNIRADAPPTPSPVIANNTASLIAILRKSIESVEAELQRRKQIRLTNAEQASALQAEQNSQRSSELMTTRDSEFELSRIADDDDSNNNILDQRLMRT